MQLNSVLVFMYAEMEHDTSSSKDRDMQTLQDSKTVKRHFNSIPTPQHFTKNIYIDVGLLKKEIKQGRC